MTVFVFLGGITVGQNVMETLSEGIITTDLTLSAGVAVLFSSAWESSSPTFSAFPSRHR